MRRSLLILIVMAACNGGTGEGVTVQDSARVRIVRNILPSPPTTCALSTRPVLSIGAADDASGEAALFDVRDAATLSDGAIAIAENATHRIKIFRPDGTFDYAFGRKGNGPGEFRTLYLLWAAAGDTIIVGDFAPWRFMYFTRDGHFRSAIEPTPKLGSNPVSAGILADGTFILARPEIPEVVPNAFVPWYQVVTYHERGGPVLDTIGRYSAGRYGRVGPAEERLWAYPLFESRARIAARGASIVLAQGRDRELAIIDRKGLVLQSVRWTGDDLSARRAEVKRYREQLLENALGPGQRRTAELMLDESRPINAQFPGVNAVEIGTDSTVWVEEYPRPSYEGVGKWLVFSPSGVFQCIVRTPRRFEPYEFSGRHILGKALDSLDVEYVVRYDVSRR